MNKIGTATAWRAPIVGAALAFDPQIPCTAAPTSSLMSDDMSIGTRAKLGFDPRQINAVLLERAGLSVRQRQVYEARFLRDSPPSLRALAAELGMSVQRAQQLEVAALRRLHRAVSCAA